MCRNVRDTQKLNSLQRVYCPQTHKLIVAEIGHEFDIPNGKVIWLQCEACGGWHIVIDNRNPAEGSDKGFS